MGNLTDFIGGQHYTNAANQTEHLNIQIITEAAYNALPTYDANTLYLITNVA